MIETVGQKEGLNTLFSFINNEAPFTELRPFVLEEDYKPGGYYLGRVGGRQLYLSLSTALEDIGQIYVNPGADINRGFHPYYWLDYYNNLNSVKDSLTNPLFSARLKPEENINKIDSKYWHNVDEQVLYDYIFRVNEILFSDLTPFSIFSKGNRGSLGSYRIAGQRQLTLSIYENSQIDDANQLRIMPHQDQQQLYQWIDILKAGTDIDETNWPLVSSYRLLQQERRITAVEWFGPEIQSLVDYLSSDPKIKFSNLRPFQITITRFGYMNIAKSRTRNVNAALNFGSESGISIGDKLLVTPQQDDQEIYQWVDLYRLDPESNTPTGPSLVAARLQEGKINQRDWLGVERQLLHDYTKGLIKFQDVKPYELTISKSKDMVSLWREGEKKIYLVLSKAFKLETGDQLSFLPDQEIEEEAFFLLKKGEVILARYKYLSDQNRFVMENNYVINNDLVLNFNEESNSYLDLEGNSWLTQDQAMRRLRVSISRLGGVLELLTPTTYKIPSIDHHLSLYRESEVLVIAEQQGIHSLDNWDKEMFSFNPDKSVLSYKDQDGTWVTKSTIFDIIVGFDDKELEERIKDVQSKQVRGISGKTIQVFNIEDLVSLPDIKKVIELPRVDRVSGILTDEEGRWASLNKIFTLYKDHISFGTLKRFVDKTRNTIGISLRRKTMLYNLDDLESFEEFRTYIMKPHVNSETSVYTDEVGDTWTDTTNIIGLTNHSRFMLERAVESGLIRTIEGRSRSGKEIVLLNCSDALGFSKNQLKKSENNEKISIISSDEADEWLRKLLQED